jgi:hypothetical protein
LEKFQILDFHEERRSRPIFWGICGERLGVRPRSGEKYEEQRGYGSKEKRDEKESPKSDAPVLTAVPSEKRQHDIKGGNFKGHDFLLAKRKPRTNV